jgi:hypothetical protein
VLTLKFIGHFSGVSRTFWEGYVRPESMSVDTLGVYCTTEKCTLKKRKGSCFNFYVFRFKTLIRIIWHTLLNLRLNCFDLHAGFFIHTFLLHQILVFAPYICDMFLQFYSLMFNLVMLRLKYD